MEVMDLSNAVLAPSESLGPQVDRGVLRENDGETIQEQEPSTAKIEDVNTVFAATTAATESVTTVENSLAKLEDGHWLHKTAAARVLGCSVATVIRRGQAGDLPVRQENRQRLYYVVVMPGAMLADRRRSNQDIIAASVVRMYALEKKSVAEICVALQCLPTFVAKQLTGYRQAEEVAESIERERVDRETARRARECVVGNVNVPTTWAWAAKRIEGGSSYLEARDQLERWVKNVGSGGVVSTLVRDALESETAWIAAITLWTQYEKANVERYLVEEESRRGLKTRHELVEIWEKEQRHLETGERRVHAQQREDDRHQREMNARSARQQRPAVGLTRPHPKVPSPQPPSTPDDSED